MIFGVYHNPNGGGWDWVLNYIPILYIINVFK